MEITDCEHAVEDTLGVVDGRNVVVCVACGQTRRYKTGDADSEVITKLGRKDEAVVIPPEGSKYDISPEEHRLLTEGWEIKNRQNESVLSSRDKKRAGLGEGKAGKIEQPAQLREEPPEEEMEPAPILEPEPIIEPEPPLAEEEREPEAPPLAEKIETEDETTVEEKEHRHYKKRPLAWWQKHLEEVKADYYTLTLRAFFKKWAISSLAWMKMRDALGIPKKSTIAAKKVAKVKKVKEGKPSEILTLPPFPPFNDKWLATVQEEWFRSYIELRKLKV